MTKERAWPVRVVYILIAAALAMGLMITMAPAQKVSANPDLSEWSRVETPTTDGWVLSPESAILDYALASDGEVAYAIVLTDFECPEEEDNEAEYNGPFYLLKSDDGAATWTDITDALDDVIDPDDEDDSYIDGLLQVATDWVDPDFVAVALWWYDYDGNSTSLSVFFSTDGGETFEDIGEVEDDGVYLDEVSDLAVSPEAGGKRDIAIGGDDDDGYAGLFRCTVTGDSAGAWEDATEYEGWDDDAFYSDYVTDIIFSSSWATDKTILVTTVIYVDSNGYDYYDVRLQSGTWGTTAGWNEHSTLGIDSVLIVGDVPLPEFFAYFNGRAIAGMALPSDYNSKNIDTRMLWVWVNYEYGTVNPDGPASEIFLVDNDDASPLGPLGQIRDGDVWLANISYKGTIAEGEAIAGLIGDEDGPLTGCCAGVQVYRNSGIHNMFICCEPWHKACKLPTGRAAMAVSYVGEDKAYAVALYGEPLEGGFEPYDESAWSVTFDDGDTFNQLSLVDTSVDYFSDVAVSPDCNKTFLVSVNKVEIDWCEDGSSTGCDSVWVHADTFPEAGFSEYSGHWLRTWSGQLEGTSWYGGDCWDGDEAGMLRLAPEETTGETVYLFDYSTSNVYRNDLETLACWDKIGSTELDDIVDLAAQDKDTIFALDYDGDVAMFDEDEWQEAVESKIDYGYTIAVWGDYILVGGEEGDVSYSHDGGETFTELKDVVSSDDADVTVAFDTYFDTNKTIYAAVGWADDGYSDPDNGIYRWVINATDEKWTDLKAEPLESQLGIDDGDDEDETVEVTFTGLVVDRPGNPFTSSTNGGVIYASYVGYLALNATHGYWFTGAARSLERQVTVCTTCLVWDFLWQGLTSEVGLAPWECPPEAEGFEAYPDALKICGCLTPDTNTNLFAIDNWHNYDVCDGEEGAVWTFEDCYAKKAPEPQTPMVEADPCSCYAAPFTLKWDTLCDACVYEIQFALDAEFTMPVQVNGEGDVANDYIITGLTGDTPAYSILGGENGGLSCETTYYWRVRASKAATDQVIHSWWSVPDSFTVPPSVQAGIITLVAPVPGALNQPIKSVGFSWDLQADADAFTWVLSKNADLSAPLDSKNVTSKAATYANTLDHGTTYYWQVKAYNEGNLVGASSIGTFTTGATGPFCDPIDGLCFDTQAELTAHEATAHPSPGTPFWVWVVIAIGAVLVIVVIVLIFRTRRV